MPWDWVAHGVRRSGAKYAGPRRRDVLRTHRTLLSLSVTDADGGGRTLMASGRRFLRPVRIPIPPHPHEEPQVVTQTGGSSSQAAGRGGCRFDRAASRRAWRRDSSTTTLAGRCGCLGRAATRTRCRFISSPLCAWNRPARGRTRTSEVGARRASAYTTGLRERTTRIERVSPEWRSGALPTELRPREEPPAGVEPAPRPYKGRVLAVHTTEARWRRRESNPLLLVASEVLCH
jgi:hypothetical protein